MASIISAGTTSGTSLNLSADTSGVLQLATNGTTTALTIDTSQNVGIGTASPSARLDVSGGSIRVNEDGVGTKVITIRSNYAGVDPAINVITNNSLLFLTNNTERMRITSGGDVLFPYNTTIAWNSTANQYIQADSNAIYLGTANEYRILISTNGNATFKNNISVGNATPTTSGTGITFPATQSASSNANTLDDYEEGSFTPTVRGTGTAGTGTYGNQSGFYTKIGNRVLFQCYVSWTNLVGATGFLAMGGLPFTSNSSSGSYAACSTWNSGITLSANNVLLAYINPNSSNIDLVQYPVGGGGDTNIAIDTVGAIMVAGHYFV